MCVVRVCVCVGVLCEEVVVVVVLWNLLPFCALIILFWNSGVLFCGGSDFTKSQRRF